MLRLSLIILSLILSRLTFAQQMFPAVQGKALDDKSVDLPDAIKGKYALFGFAVSDKAESSLMSWAQPVYDNFISGTGMMSGLYDVQVYFVPLLNGVQLAAKDRLIRDFKSGTDKELLPHVLFIEGSSDQLRSALKIDKKEVPYIFLVNPEGKIVYSTSGSYSDSKLEKIEDLLMEE